MRRKKVNWDKFLNRHSSKSMLVIKLSFCVLFFCSPSRFSATRYMKVKRMEITEILRRIWLFSVNKIKSSESFSKKPTQLIVELNSSLRQIIDSLVNCDWQYIFLELRDMETWWRTWWMWFWYKINKYCWRRGSGIWRISIHGLDWIHWSKVF